MVTDDGLEVFRRFQPPQQALLTTRHHYRGCDAFVDRFGVTVVCASSGLHEFEGTDRRGEGFGDGDEVAPGVVAAVTNSISDDDTTFLIAHGGGSLAFGDGLVRPPGAALGFVPDSMMDEPEKTKEGLTNAYRGLLERDFDHLLFAHGARLIGGGHAAGKEWGK